jgi:hypothetical protein
VDSLSGLDLAALIRVFDQNWNSLGYRLHLDQQTRNWLKEAKGIRDRWAHLPPGGLRPDDAYRDIDTLYRFLGVLGADQAIFDRAQAERGRMLEELAPRPKDKQGALQSGQSQEGISKGMVVRLRARPAITGAVLEVHSGDPESRYTVFHGGEIATYYESQIEPIVRAMRPDFSEVSDGAAILLQAQAVDWVLGDFIRASGDPETHALRIPCSDFFGRKDLVGMYMPLDQPGDDRTSALRHLAERASSFDSSGRIRMDGD